MPARLGFAPRFFAVPTPLVVAAYVTLLAPLALSTPSPGQSAERSSVRSVLKEPELIFSPDERLANTSPPSEAPLGALLANPGEPCARLTLSECLQYQLKVPKRVPQVDGLPAARIAAATPAAETAPSATETRRWVCSGWEELWQGRGAARACEWR